MRVIPTQGLRLLKGMNTNSNILPKIELNIHISEPQNILICIIYLFYSVSCRSLFSCVVILGSPVRLVGLAFYQDMYPSPFSFFLISSSDSDSSSLEISFSKQ